MFDIATPINKAQHCLVVVCGGPGAGKSTLCSCIVAGLEGAVVQANHVEFDQFVEEKTPFDPKAWRQGRAMALAAVENSIACSGDQKLSEAGSKYKLTFADDNMYYRSMRWSLFKLACKHAAAYVQLFVTCPQDIAHIRNQSRSAASRVPDEVLCRMYKVLEAPDGSRFKWEATTVVVDASDHQVVCCRAIWQSIWGLWGQPAELPIPDDATRAAEQEASRAQTAASTLHQFDLCLRAYLSATLQRVRQQADLQVRQSTAVNSRPAVGQRGTVRGQTGVELAVAAQELNQQRRAMLQAVKAALAAKDECVQELVAVCEEQFTVACNAYRTAS